MTLPLQADVTSFSRTLLVGAYPELRVVTEMPANLADILPVIRVVRVGGGDDGIVLDQALVAYHCFHISDAAARELAYGVNTALRAGLGSVHNGVTMSRYRKLSGPVWAGYENTLIRQYVVMFYQWIKVAASA